MNDNEVVSYEQRYINQIFGVMGVGDNYLNDNMKQDLISVINKIYEDGFIDGHNSKG